MKFVEILKSLFIPKKMVKYRSTTVFFAIIIFILSSYLLVVPADYKVKHSFNKNIEENNILYLQAIQNIPEGNKEVENIFKELYEKKLSVTSDDRLLQSSNMVFNKLNKADSSALGVITKSKDNKWVFDEQITEILVPENSTIPYFDIKDGKLLVNNVELSDTELTGKVETIKVSVNSKTGYFVLNSNITDDEGNTFEKITNISFTKNDVNVKVVDGYVYINDVNTEFKTNASHVVFYYEPTNVEYYENSFEYTNDLGKKINFTFVVDLSQKGDLYNPNESFKYSEEKFPNITTTEYYLVLLTYNQLYYQAHPNGIDEKKIEDATTNNDDVLRATSAQNFFTSVNFNSDSFENTKLAKETLIKILKQGYVSKYNTMYSIITFIYTVIFPLFITFIFWLFFKKNGKLKKMREYYNIAGVTNIACSLFVFVILWFYPDGIGNLYPFIFALYYLFVLYKINSSREIEETIR